MKLISLIGVAALFVATSAFAYDMSYMGPIKAKETKSIKIHLPAGKSIVEVWSPGGNSKFNCQFAASAYGVEFEQTNTTKCLINPLVKDDMDIQVNITNLEASQTDWRIWVHDPQ